MNRKPEEFKFNPRLSTEEGLVAIGGELTVSRLIEAYQMGIFPWPQEGLPMLWFSPLSRGVLDFSDLRLNRSLKKFLRNLHLKSLDHPAGENLNLDGAGDAETSQSLWFWSVNRAFDEVIHECQIQPRPGQEGTWILPEMKMAYQQLHRAGRSLSIEIWESESAEASSFRLIGGIYGVRSDRYFSAESMFHKESNASKLAFLVLIHWLGKNGFSWLDIQMLTEVSSSLGGKYIEREEFLRRIGV